MPQELRDKLLQQHKDTETSLSKVHNARRQQQLKNLRDKMAQRRKRRFDKLRDEQEKYKNEVRFSSNDHWISKEKNYQHFLTLVLYW